MIVPPTQAAILLTGRRCYFLRTKHETNPVCLVRDLPSTYTFLRRIRAMGQVTIYLDDQIEKRMTANAKAMKLSKSKWIANVIREKLVDEWPANVRKLGRFPDLGRDT